MDQEDSPNPSEKIAARVTSAVDFLTEIQVAVKRTGAGFFRLLSSNKTGNL
jgi:hypothetical protein